MLLCNLSSITWQVALQDTTMDVFAYKEAVGSNHVFSIKNLFDTSTMPLVVTKVHYSNPIIFPLFPARACPRVLEYTELSSSYVKMIIDSSKTKASKFPL